MENKFSYVVVGVCDRYIAYLLFVRNCAFKQYLIATRKSEKTNHVTIIRSIQEELANIFLSNPIPIYKIVLLFSDAASYMIKLEIGLKVFHPSIIDSTCGVFILIGMLPFISCFPVYTE